jgi:hypothetical protein
VLDSFADVPLQRIIYNTMIQYGRCRLADLSETERSEISAQVRDQCVASGLPVPSALLQDYLIGLVHAAANSVRRRAEARLNNNQNQ